MTSSPTHVLKDLSLNLNLSLSLETNQLPNNHSYQTWVMLGDGETQEGQIWEAMMAANYHELNNLHVIVDRNRIQNDDFVNVQMEVGDLASKIKSFGWEVKEIDGHNMQEIVEALQWSMNSTSPSAIVAHTVKGKGVSFMEDNPAFHGKAPNDSELEQALEELS